MLAYLAVGILTFALAWFPAGRVVLCWTVGLWICALGGVALHGLLDPRSTVERGPSTITTVRP